MIIDGKKVAAELREELKKKVTNLKSKYNAVPGLTVILVGEDVPSKIYVKNKEKSAIEVGINSEVIRYPENIEVKNEITLKTAGNKKETYISNQKETVKEEPRFSSSSPRYRKSKGIYSDTEEKMHYYLKIVTCILN